ncbi:12658_t:CDS:2 [Dentiscutata erythropus]|uniref:12658_t:CDS:1 n=1 Tax=Dentiscutata erythropus TaxID=1348616 RepID=A0A9N9F718_9GLOM|nr:12658_t:CDS:2 [Dentiscutata erythropus]
MSKYKAMLLLQGKLVQTLHFGPYAKNWWISCLTHDLTYTFLYPVCLSMKTITIVNHRDFIITVVQNNFEPRYICQSEALQSNICRSLSEAITSIYQQAFFTKTRLDGLLVMGYCDSEICKMLLSSIYFHSYTITTGSLNLTIFGIGKSNNPNWNYARKGYRSSFVHNFRKTRLIFFQEFNNKEAIVRIYQNFQEIQTFCDTNPNSIWNKIGILTQFTGSILFGLEHEWMKSKISKELTLLCTKKYQYVYKMKKNFINWKNQESNIIELTTKLQEIYPPDYTIEDCELHVWKTLLQYTGCTNRTPFGKESTFEFWTQSKDPTNNQAMLKQLYENRYFSTENHESDAAILECISGCLRC